MKRDEIVVGVVIFFFGATTVLLSLKMPIGKFRMAGTGMFPLSLGILLMILSGVFVLRLFFQGKEGQVKMEGSFESSESPMPLILFLGTMVLATRRFCFSSLPLFHHSNIPLFPAY